MRTWSEINGYDYVVSKYGQIRRKGSENDHSVRSDNKGYLCVDLYKNGKRSTKKVHRLVADAFIPNPKRKPCVNHKDGNKLNNSFDNLEWVTSKENCRHAWKNGLATPSYGMKGKKNPNGGRKGVSIMIVETGEIFSSAIECSKRIGGGPNHIYDCLKGRQETHRGYHFKYV